MARRHRLWHHVRGGVGRFQADDRGFWRTYSMLLAIGLILGGVVVVAETRPVTEDETADQFIEHQLQQTAADILAAGNASGRLHNATVYWNPQAERWHDAASDPPSDVYYSSLPSDHPLTPVVEAAKANDQFAINIEVQYQDGGATNTQRVVYQGPPGRHAVASSYRLVLKDGDRIRNPDGTRGCTLGELDSGACPGSYFAPDAFGSDIYNIVEVRVILWKT